MSMKQLFVNLKELEHVRIQCLGCLCVVQLPLRDLAATYQLNQCPICSSTFGQLWSQQLVGVQLAKLAEIIQDLMMVKLGQVEVSFVLHDKG